MGNKNWNITPEVCNQNTRRTIWRLAVGSGGITMTVLYYISQLPYSQQVAIKAALEAFFAIK